ncbi:hypothetical protein F511_21636 [Dorcoceras hygrometricum]|uniref:Uncharacterized protein n=1 Tax=Dorcoceras hygrometricum TaxID=472368 RepID=A0A2Z7A408_9LAMI|nr:hypothetical protein F511_21636 [Dorcoceras hygrometricum]
MRTRSEKIPNRKNDRKVLVAEESNKNWADSDSETTSSSSSSSDSEQEEVHCLMENQTTEDEVFYFSNTEFTRDDLINALNEMVHEYRKLSQTFEEVKAKNKGLKNSSVESSTAQLEDTDSLKTELSKLMIENESLRNNFCELTSENKRLNHVMSSWTKSSVSLGKLHETQKQLNDKTGLVFSVGERGSGKTSTRSDLAYDKFNKMNFFKTSVTHDTCESVKYDDQISPKLNYKGKAGIGYTRPENNKPIWLKNRLDKDKAKSKSSVPNQQRHDILAKSVTVKAGSFDAVTHECFLLMMAIHFGLKINWSKILFDILKGMVTKTSKQAKGFAAQICVLLKGAPNLTLGEAKTFPRQKILSAKKAAMKRRPDPAVVEPATKKKQTTVGRAAPAEKDLAMVPVVQNPEPISVVPATTPKAPHRRAPKRKLVMQKGSDDEIVDSIIHQVIADTTAIETGEPDFEEPVLREKAELAEKETDVREPDVVESVVVEITETVDIEPESRIDVSSITNYDEEHVVGTAEEKEADKVLALTVKSTSDEESIPIDDLLAKIPADMMLPSVTAEEPTKISFGLGIEIPGVNDGDWYKASLPQIAVSDKGKAPLVEKDEIKGHPA